MIIGFVRGSATGIPRYLPKMNRTFNEIWQGVLDKDPECWSELVHLLEPLVYAVARKTGLSPAECEDCAQDVWLSLLRTRHTIKEPDRIPAWLSRAVSRRAVRIAKARGKDLPSDSAEERAAIGELPDDVLVRLETAAILRLAMGALPPHCRRLLDALYFSPEEKKYSDIARDLGLPANSLGPTRSRCLNKLRSILEGIGFDRVLIGPDRDP
jgi:RNA polymerase sigma factor (sigma-70 family)